MSSSKYQCCVCGCLIKVKKDRTEGVKLICPECGEAVRIRPLETGLKKFLHGGSAIKQPLAAIISPANGISSPQYRGKTGPAGCSRLPTCCGKAEPCDAPPCIDGICVVTLEPRTLRQQSRLQRDYRR